MAWVFGMFCVSVPLGFFKSYNQQVLKQYLTSQETIDKIVHKLPLFFLLIFLLSSFIILNGTIKALGLQSKAVVASIICLYCVSLPLSYVIGFKPELLWKSETFAHLKGINGLFVGFCIGLAVLNLVYFYLVCALDWRENS